MRDQFKVQVFGCRGKDWEISLVRHDNEHGQKSWGWCDDDISDLSKCKKILIGTYQNCHCAGTMIPEAFDMALQLAHNTLLSMPVSDAPVCDFMLEDTDGGILIGRCGVDGKNVQSPKWLLLKDEFFTERKDGKEALDRIKGMINNQWPTN